jgi:hypothetical protein
MAAPPSATARRRLAALSHAIITSHKTAAASASSEFHWIGEPSAIAEALSPPPDNPVFSAGGFTQVTANARELRDSLLLADGSPPELYHSGLQHQGIARRFADLGDELLPPSPERIGVADQLRAYVEAIEQLSLEVRNTPFFCAPFYTLKLSFLPRQAWDKHRESTQKERRVVSKEMPIAATAMTSPEEAVEPQELIAAAVIAASRSSELVADHHGGPLHVTAGAWSVLLVARHLRERSQPEWARLALVQALANTNRHIQVGAKLGGAVCMPVLEPLDGFEEVRAGNPFFSFKTSPDDLPRHARDKRNGTFEGKRRRFSSVGELGQSERARGRARVLGRGGEAAAPDRGRARAARGARGGRKRWEHPQYSARARPATQLPGDFKNASVLPYLFFCSL